MYADRHLHSCPSCAAMLLYLEMQTFPCLTGGSATARRRAKGTTANGALHGLSRVQAPSLQIAQQARASHQGGMTTRSRSKCMHWNASLRQSGEQESRLQRGRRQHCQRSPRPSQQVPNGPLVISAGWGRTGTSSLKVRPLHHEASHKSVHCLHAPALQIWASRPCSVSCRGCRACKITLLCHTCHIPSNTDMLNWQHMSWLHPKAHSQSCSAGGSHGP